MQSSELEVSYFFLLSCHGQFILSYSRSYLGLHYHDFGCGVSILGTNKIEGIPILKLAMVKRVQVTKNCHKTWSQNLVTKIGPQVCIPQVYIPQAYIQQEPQATSRNFNEPEDSSNSVNDPILSEPISVLRSSVRSHATHAIGELKKKS